jgi:hypothetical protein
MLHRIINWITNPFKKKEADQFTIPEAAPLSEDVKNKIKADLIEVVKEFKEKQAADLDTLPLTRVSEEAKEKIAEIVKEDITNQMANKPSFGAGMAIIDGTDDYHHLTRSIDISDYGTRNITGSTTSYGVYPTTEEVVVNASTSETPKTKKKRYYKKKKKATQEQPKETAAIKPTKNKGSKK